MIIKGSELLGLELLNKHKQQIGYTVKEIVYTNKGFYIAGLLLESENGKKESLPNCKVICYKKILDINNGIITLNEKSIVTLKQRPDLYHLVENPIKVIGFEIYTNEKELVGIVKDTIIEKNNGKMLGLVLSEGLFTDIYKGYSILPLDPKLTLIDNRSVVINSRKLHNIFHYNGGLKKILGIDIED